MSSCITIRKREHAYKFTRWCDPPGEKHRQAPSSSSGQQVKVLLKIGDLGLKNKDFIHTPTLDPILLQETGMDTEFDLIFQMLGWTNF